MKKKLAIWLALCVIWGAGWNAAAAQGEAWSFDPFHSSVTFTIRHILAKVAGTFDEVQGHMVFDPARPEAGAVTVTIPVNSINTRVEKRDAHLRSSDFFDAEKYPVMTFESTQILSGKSTTDFIARGTLTIKNVRRPLDLPFRYLGSTVHPMDPSKEIIGFEAHTTIDRLEFGVGNGEFFQKGLIGKEVSIAIYVEMLRDRVSAK
ncbi:YceI family protein [Desulfosoma caldarium]|uniref:Polyisoprenoid-binding protein YceI n=1 Tax=Desulfosoma caldarium TaxID=610254 RepID=A0A3N1UT13_9BACT|nr:YceI family protein [Desulfosoma caldarium]ROQ93283.1 polyisoprenoid-binding protein YceI [Desulfosoma caldarium]